MENEIGCIRGFACIYFAALFTILVVNYGSYPVKEYVYIRDTMYVAAPDTALRDPVSRKKEKGRITKPDPWWHKFSR